MDRPIALAAVLGALLVGVAAYILIDSLAVTVVLAVLALVAIIVVGRRLRPPVPRDTPPEWLGEAPVHPAPAVPPAAREPDSEVADAAPVFPFEDRPALDELPDDRGNIIA